MNNLQEEVPIAEPIVKPHVREHVEEDQQYACTESYCHITVLDYDDTILPSTWLSQVLSYTSTLSPDMVAELHRVENAAYKLLSEALQLSTVVIVTNAEEGWVEQSANVFLPKLAPLLERITVVSARSRYESEYPTESSKWKQLTFEEEIHQIASQNNDYVSLLSIGDSLHEREATFAYGRSNNHVIAKSIKMIDLPSPSQLATQQELIARALSSMILSRETLDLKLSVQN